MGLEEIVTGVLTAGIAGAVKRALAWRCERQKQFQPPPEPTKEEQIRDLATAIRLYVQSNTTNRNNTFSAERLAAALRTDTTMVEKAVDVWVAQGKAHSTGLGYVFTF
jgi:hypothetical protein